MTRWVPTWASDMPHCLRLQPCISYQGQTWGCHSQWEPSLTPVSSLNSHLTSDQLCVRGAFLICILLEMCLYRHIVVVPYTLAPRTVCTYFVLHLEHVTHISHTKRAELVIHSPNVSDTMRRIMWQCISGVAQHRAVTLQRGKKNLPLYCIPCV